MHVLLTYLPSTPFGCHKIVCHWPLYLLAAECQLTRTHRSRMQVLQTRAPMLSTLYTFALRDGPFTQSNRTRSRRY